jgi:xanthine permease XanP
MTNASNTPIEELIDEGDREKISTHLIYGLEDRPPFIEAFLVALQHVLAIFVGIITPPLIICNALKLEPIETSYIISMSLFISGIATFIQAKRIGPIGSGLLSIQGTSFAFVGPMLGLGLGVVAKGGTGTDALALIFGVCFFGAFIEIFLSRFLHLASKIITPLVTGTVVTIIGLSLIKVGVVSMGGGFAAKGNDTFGSTQNLFISSITLLTIIILNATKNRYLRMGSIVIGLVVGYAVSLAMGIVDFSGLSKLPPFVVPIPFKYGLNFDFAAFIPFIFLYLITTIESIGDLTATSAVSGEPIGCSL